MSIQNIPEIFLPLKKQNFDHFVYDFKMTEDAVNSKVNLTINMFSFLQTGAKKVQFADNVVEVNNKQSVLIKAGNCLMTELLFDEEIYFCKLFFFTNKMIDAFFIKHHALLKSIKISSVNRPYFLIKNDDFIDSFVRSISSIIQLKSPASAPLLAVKFEEIMLYLSHKYGASFIHFAHSLSAIDQSSSFHKIVEANVTTNLNLTDIAFLANMSLSIFKRHFEKEFHCNPWKVVSAKKIIKCQVIVRVGRCHTY